LEKAIAAEKYEDAAHIRDQIREMESKLKIPSGAT
jgi:protein-arginine kinase activator protein McsA